MKVEELLGEVSQGHNAGLLVKGIGETKEKIGVGKVLLAAAAKSQVNTESDTSSIKTLMFGQQKGLFGKWVEVEQIPVDNVTEVKNLNEVGNDVYFQLTFSNGETSIIKTWKNLKNGSRYSHPASIMTEMFITKFVK